MTPQTNAAPHAWLHDVLDRILLHPRVRITELLPYNWKLPVS